MRPFFISTVLLECDKGLSINCCFNELDKGAPSAITESVVFRYAPEVVQPHLVLAACQLGPPCPADQSMGIAEMFPSSMLGV